MPKPKLIFSCSYCDAQFPKWIGRCEQCGKWGTINSTPTPPPASSPLPTTATVAAKKPTSLTTVTDTHVERISSGHTQIDEVLGGGFVAGSLTLLGGDPGVGKSTLALAISAHIPNSLYISAEESLAQISLRAKRLGVTTLSLLHETQCETLVATIAKEQPPLAIIDSIQTISSRAASGEVGSVSQIKACTAQILEIAKRTGVAVLLIGHVTKDGAVAGPKTLEHLVDTVLYLEGDEQRDVRILRSTKHRFGATDTIGIFAMQENGLQPILNPTAAFLPDQRAHTPGVVLSVTMDGKQPLVIEVQALTTKTTFGYPQRRVSGCDLNRLQVLLAVLIERAKLPLAQYDVHVNIVGGITVKEPAVDLAIALAIISSLKNIALPRDTVAFGEVGLGGEIRPIRYLEKRIAESTKMGFGTIFSPQHSLPAKTTQLLTITDALNHL